MSHLDTFIIAYFNFLVSVTLSLMLYINISSLRRVTGQISQYVITTLVFHSSFTFDSAIGQIQYTL